MPFLLPKCSGGRVRRGGRIGRFGWGGPVAFLGSLERVVCLIRAAHLYKANSCRAETTSACTKKKIRRPSSWYSRAQTANSSRKPRAGTPSSGGTPCPLPLAPSQKSRRTGGESRPEGGSRLERGQKSRLVVFFGLYTS